MLYYSLTIGHAFLVHVPVCVRDAKLDPNPIIKHYCNIIIVVNMQRETYIHVYGYASCHNRGLTVSIEIRSRLKWPEVSDTTSFSRSRP